MNLSRRAFVGGGLVALMAPAIIRTPGLLMPIKPFSFPVAQAWLKTQIEESLQKDLVRGEKFLLPIANGDMIEMIARNIYMPWTLATMKESSASLCATAPSGN